MEDFETSYLSWTQRASELLDAGKLSPAESRELSHLIKLIEAYEGSDGVDELNIELEEAP